MPRGLFVNGVTALEGVLQFASSRPRHELDDVTVGSFELLLVSYRTANEAVTSGSNPAVIPHT
jgi:hypothetical protein